MPNPIDDFIDIDVVATSEKITNSIGDKVIYQVISKILYNGIDITRQISRYNIKGYNNIGLSQTIASFLTAPIELIQLHSNIGLEKVAVAKALLDEDDLLF